MNRRQQLMTLSAAGVAAAAAGAGWAWWRGGGETAAPGPDFWALRFDRPEGGQLALASLRGKPWVLNFWATWCPPCIKELPDLDRLHRAQTGPGGRGVQVVALAVDGPTPVRQFLARHPVSFAVGLAGFEGTDLSRSLGNTRGALPFTVVFDKTGQVRHRKLGQTEFDELTRWVQAL